MTTDGGTPSERTDDSPMLLQPDDASAPMIGGRGAKVLVEARGAYLSGNLRALMDHLDPSHRERLHVRMVEQAIWHARQAVPAEAWHPSIQPIIDASNHALEIASKWLVDGNPQASYDMIEVLSAAEIVSTTNCVTSYGMMFAFLSCTLLTSSIDDMIFWIERSIGCALYYRHKSRHLSEDEYQIAKQAASHWQVETAWAIMHQRHLPALENL